MALGRARADRRVDYWPGFVDALSTLLMVFIFLVSIFTVAQFFLSREIAGQGRFPAVDVLASVSRTIVDLVGPTHLTLARKLRGMLATYQRAEDLIRIGGYVKGSDPRVDEAIERIDAIHAFLSQSHDESVDLERSVQQMALAVGSTGSV